MEKLGLLELLERDGSVRQSIPVTHWPVSIGRDVQCDLVLDDVHVAPRHALIDWQAAEQPEDAGQAQLQLLDSLNGAVLASGPMAGGQRVSLVSGQEWQMGHTRLRLRLAGVSLPPEQALVVSHAARWWAIVLVLLGSLLQAAFQVYISSVPDEFWTAFLPSAFGVLTTVAIWAAVWAFATKLFQRRLVFWQHVWLASSAWLGGWLVVSSLHLLAYSLSWAWLGAADSLVYAVVGAMLVNAHLQIVQPLKRRASRWVAGAICVLLLASTWGMTWYRHQRLNPELFMTTLLPPSLRLASGASVDDFLQRQANLQAALDKKAKEPVDGVEDAGAFSDED